jgi:hypothetical protein
LPYLVLGQTATQSFASGVQTDIIWDAVLNQNSFPFTGPNATITFPAAGWYTMVANYSTTLATGAVIHQITVNGVLVAQIRGPAPSTMPTTQNLTAAFLITSAGQTGVVSYRQASGASVDSSTGLRRVSIRQDG